ncbi:hypothetical protein [Candidatus Lokiarchaeum ossiferum]|uniref:hypothetical protein n=1 Tax=Candidatus Lokiarchaeum ossiferum TaxID=2951803 RepID=UPI00352CFACB
MNEKTTLLISERYNENKLMLIVAPRKAFVEVEFWETFAPNTMRKSILLGKISNNDEYYPTALEFVRQILKIPEKQPEIKP